MIAMKRGWMLVSVLLALLSGCAECAVAQTPLAVTTVQDTVYTASGATASGTVLLSWSGFTTASGAVVPAGTTSATIGTGGLLSITLAPNAGATPIGSYYTATFHLSDGSSSREYWVIPVTVAGAPPVKLAAIRNDVLPTSVAMQTVSKAYVDTAIAAARLPVFGPSGSSHAPGIVPDPGATAGTTHYLREDGTWDIPPSGGSGTMAAQNNPMTTLGDTIYGGASGVLTRLAGNTSATACVITETGTGSAAQAPACTNTPAVSVASMTGNGTFNVPAKINLTAQTADVSLSTAYSPPATGYYQVCASMSVTTAATSSSTLPVLTVRYTDANDSNEKFTTLLPALSTDTGNSANFSVKNGCGVVYSTAAAGHTAIRYQTSGYATSGATSMQFDLQLTITALNASGQ